MYNKHNKHDLVKKYRNLRIISAKREYRNENIFSLSKIIFLLIWNKKQIQPFV